MYCIIASLYFDLTFALAKFALDLVLSKRNILELRLVFRLGLGLDMGIGALVPGSEFRILIAVWYTHCFYLCNHHVSLFFLLFLVTG